jgi:hypothetical protein
MITVSNLVGHFGGVRFTAPVTSEDVAGLSRRLRELLTASPRAMAFCTDMRGARVVAPEVVDRLVEMMRADNPKIERNAILVGEGNVFALQLDRMRREAGASNRPLFRDEKALVASLAEVLSPAELVALGRFLAGEQR